MKKIAVLTSGGDAPGMNACLRAVVRTGLHFGLEVVGVRRGYEGLIEGSFTDMDRFSVSNILHLGGTILNTARSARFRTEAGRAEAFKQLKKANIEALVAIGGDGTFTGAHIFNEEHDFPIIGCPGTIDNDLFGTDFTIGYDTAINTAMAAIDNIKDTANSHERIFFIEVMGRDAGFIALRSGIACGAEAVLIPETPTNIDELVKRLTSHYDAKRTSSIIVVAEGDQSGGAFKIAKGVQKRNKNFDIRVSILGHIQRGGRPTCMERVRASRMGLEAVKALLQGKRDLMVGIIHDEVVLTPFEQAIKHNNELNPVLLELVKILS